MAALVLTGLNAFAQDTYPCEFQGLRSVTTETYPGTPSPTFNFRYQVIGDINPDDFVIIHIPGGPGGSSINDFENKEVKERYVKNSTLPENIPWIMIDPRTVGCNRGDETIFPDDTLTSEVLAQDILSVIEDLKLKKYIIYGHSYGSQSATVVAAFAKQRGLPAPYAVILTGVLGIGKADGSFSIPNQKILEWDAIVETLSPKAKAILETESPLEFEAWNWSRFIGTGLYDGYYMVEGKYVHPLKDKLRLLESDDPADLQKFKDAFQAKNIRPGMVDWSERLFAKVDCHEYSPADGYTLFVNGKLIFDEENNPCKGEAFDRKFDSAEYQMNTSLYYLSGTNDVAAPYEGARYHFENQTSSRRNFVVVPGGGHTNLGWVMQDCKELFWDAVLKRQDLTDVLPNCKAPLKLEVLP